LPYYSLSSELLFFLPGNTLHSLFYSGKEITSGGMNNLIVIIADIDKAKKEEAFHLLI